MRDDELVIHIRPPQPDDGALDRFLLQLNVEITRCVLGRAFTGAHRQGIELHAAPAAEDIVTTLAAGFNWDGGANSDPIKDLHAAIGRSEEPFTVIVSEPRYQSYLMWELNKAEMPYRVRLTAWELWRAACRRYDRGGPIPTAEKCFARARALEP